MLLQNRYYRLLNLPIHFFDRTALTRNLLGTFDNNKNKHWNKIDYIFNESARIFFSNFNYKLINAELFYTPPSGQLLWHIDMNPHYIKLAEHEIHSICKVQIDNVALVNVGRPHRVVNYSKNPRWCLCAILERDSRRITFDQAVSDLNGYVVN
jgi:hypothetical protein